MGIEVLGMNHIFEVARGSINIYIFMISTLFIALMVIKALANKSSKTDKKTSKFLKKNLDDKYEVISNISLYVENEESLNIDHIVLSKFGIFVIKAEKRKGTVIGSKHSVHWAEIAGKTKRGFANPIFQANNQAEVIRNLIGVEDNQIFPLAVFLKGVDFGIDMPAEVTHIDGIIGSIKAKRNRVFSQDEIYCIRRTIEDYSVVEKKRLFPYSKDREEINNNQPKTTKAA